MKAYELIGKMNLVEAKVWKDGKAIFQGQAKWLRDIHGDELKELSVISVGVNDGTIVIGVK